ncbi:MAG: copper-binding protein [Gemmataceae bacterium]|nr:copper-binding protein [Gemmataceae bacterium]
MKATLMTHLPAVLLAALVGLAGCQGPSGSSEKDAGKVYDVTGTVVSVDPGKKAVTLDHQDIPGLMKAMTMEFSAESESVLSGVKAGDAVSGKVRHEGGKYVVTELKKR